MSFRAKFTVTGIMDHGSGKTVHMAPQYDERIPEDRRFFQYTPTGKFEMFTNNPAVLDQITIGQAFYLDFTPVPPTS